MEWTVPRMAGAALVGGIAVTVLLAQVPGADDLPPQASNAGAGDAQASVETAPASSAPTAAEPATPQPSPRTPTGLQVRMVSTGSWHACAVTTDSAAYCWGENSQGQLGDGTLVDSGEPVRVMGLRGKVVNVSAGNATTCATMKSGSVQCWGSNQSGALGDGSDVPYSTRPVPVAGLEGDWAGVGVGWSFACARSDSGDVRCWGSNRWGQLGSGSTAGASRVPVAVAGLNSQVRRMGVGLTHACATLRSGDAVCWGGNSSGQLGDGTTTNASRPVAVTGLGGVVGLAARALNTCARTTGGAALCWGDNSSGQVGNGQTGAAVTTPTRVVGLSVGVDAITTGRGSSCASRGGALWCWGRGTSGGLATGTSRNSLAPVPAKVLTDGVTLLASGELYSCAVRAKRAYCWGDNARGSVGVGTIGGIVSEPVLVAL